MSHRSKLHSRKLVVKPDSSEERDLFLELGLPMLNDIGAKVSSSLNRIELELIGEYEVVDRLIGQLRSLENMIYAATHPDKEGQYQYHANLLSRVYTPPVNLDLFASCLAVSGYVTEVLNEQLSTQAPMPEVGEVHARIIHQRRHLSEDINRDIERFVISLALEMEDTTADRILDMAITKELVSMTPYGYQFTVSPSRARRMILETMGLPLPAENFEESDDFSMSAFGFDGGKIVFLKDGQEVDSSELELDES